jgi:hypothetical protein
MKPLRIAFRTHDIYLLALVVRSLGITDQLMVDHTNQPQERLGEKVGRVKKNLRWGSRGFRTDDGCHPVDGGSYDSYSQHVKAGDVCRHYCEKGKQFSISNYFWYDEAMKGGYGHENYGL